MGFKSEGPVTFTWKRISDDKYVLEASRWFKEWAHFTDGIKDRLKFDSAAHLLSAIYSESNKKVHTLKFTKKVDITIIEAVEKFILTDNPKNMRPEFEFNRGKLPPSILTRPPLRRAEKKAPTRKLVREQPGLQRLKGMVQMLDTMLRCKDVTHKTAYERLAKKIRRAR